jgi:ABC-type sugar transport system permease subunit
MQRPHRYHHFLPLYALLLPSLCFLGVFVFYPNLAIFYRAFFNWVPGMVVEWVGWANFRDLWVDPMFWQSFELVAILLVSSLLKVLPAIAVALVLHRLASERMRGIYRGLFVVPFVIPTLVWLLLWKSFYDPTLGIINKVLSATGLMRVLAALDGTEEAPGWMPLAAGWADKVASVTVAPLLGSVWALIFAGIGLMLLSRDTAEGMARMRMYGTLFALGVLPWLFVLSLDYAFGWVVVSLLVLLALWPCALYLHGRAGTWLIWLAAGVLVFHDQPYRILILVAVTLAFNEWVLSQNHHYRARALVGRIGCIVLGIGIFWVLLAKGWTTPTGEFVTGQPAWLGSQYLVIPSIILWGFPWVGTIGVLIYLAGLQQIPRNAYESARMEGVSAWRMVTQVELPMLAVQIRIHLVLLTLATLTQYEFFLLLLGTDGGPNGRGMVPGLYMFGRAFEAGQFGYAAAIGVVVFAAVLLLTVVYTRILKGQK